ncbi:hypothetical protein IFR05_007315 [Cadophora sp. M221]|nr:hypothetical protein IFR05_007315 [Cadophora sp. M221]
MEMLSVGLPVFSPATVCKDGKDQGRAPATQRQKVGMDSGRGHTHGIEDETTNRVNCSRAWWMLGSSRYSSST